MGKNRQMSMCFRNVLVQISAMIVLRIQMSMRRRPLNHQENGNKCIEQRDIETRFDHACDMLKAMLSDGESYARR